MVLSGKKKARMFNGRGEEKEETREENLERGIISHGRAVRQ